MKAVPTFSPLHTHDYRAAIVKAVEWLGDRYLLAKEIPRKAGETKPISAAIPAECREIEPQWRLGMLDRTRRSTRKRAAVSK
jgi:hypothetical protein